MILVKRAPELKNSQISLAMVGENKKSFFSMTYSKDEGFRIRVYLNADMLPLEDCISKLDDAKNDPFAPPPFIVLSGKPIGVLNFAINELDISRYDPAYSKILRSAIAEVTGPEALDFVLTGDKGLEWLNYVAGGNQRARLQAIQSFPIHAELIMENPKLIEAIDKEESLSEALRVAMEMTDAQFALLSKLEVQASREVKKEPNAKTISQFGGHYRSGAYRAVDFIKPHQIPDDIYTVRRVFSFVEWCERVARDYSMGRSPIVRALKLIKKGDWEDKMVSIKGSISLTEVSDYIKTTANSITNAIIVNSLVEKGVDLKNLGRIANTIWERESTSINDLERMGKFVKEYQKCLQSMSVIREGIKKVIGENASLKDLSEFQERWHHNRYTMDNKVLSTKDDMSWNPLIGVLDLDGFRFRELSDSAALEEQGRKERHCVGGYTSVVLAGTQDSATLIFSIEKEDRVVSTIEVKVSVTVDWNRGGKKFLSWSEVQNKAASNANPGPEGREAAQALMEHLRSLPNKEVLAYMRGIETNTGQIRDQLQRMIANAGVNVFNPDIPGIVLEAFDDVLPKKLRGLSIPEWIDKTDHLPSFAQNNALLDLVGLTESMRLIAKVDEPEERCEV